MTEREHIDNIRRQLLGIACIYGDLDTINTLTEAESYLRSMADKIDDMTKTLTLPDSPGYWWRYRDSHPGYGWELFIVRQIATGTPLSYELHAFLPEGTYAGHVVEARWIKITPPSPPTR